jgi:ribosomal protein L11 methyltransferase
MNWKLMDTIKLTIALAPFEAWFSEMLMAELAEIGFDTFAETGIGFEAYCNERNYYPEKRDLLFQSKAGKIRIDWKEEKIAAQNWNEIWEKNYFSPLVIKDILVVRAPFHSNYPNYPIELVIEPNMAFGTGNHETTSLMMETMLGMEIKGKKVLDMGCGTGILSVLSSKRGAGEVVAIDIDPWAIDAVSGNIVLNNTPNIKAIQGDARDIGNQTFDILLVNIQKNVILNDMHTYSEALRADGIVLFSGFFESDIPDIIEVAKRFGLCFISSRAKNQWVVAEFRKG